MRQSLGVVIAVAAVLFEGKDTTYDQGGKAGTIEMGNAIIRKYKELSK